MQSSTKRARKLLCAWCGKERLPVPPVSRTPPLCENRCCPTCGWKLERVWKSHGNSYWSHVLPLPARACQGCGTMFLPDKLNPHQKFCGNRDCRDQVYAQKGGDALKEKKRRVSRKWRLGNPDRAKQQHARGAKKAREELQSLRAQAAEFRKLAATAAKAKHFKGGQNKKEREREILAELVPLYRTKGNKPDWDAITNEYTVRTGDTCTKERLRKLWKRS